MTINVALIGFGTVGSAVYRLLNGRSEELRRLLGNDVRVTDVVIQDGKKKRAVTGGTRVTTDIESVFSRRDIDVVIEAIIGIEPAKTILWRALKKGIPVITANKELFAHEGSHLRTAAETTDTPIGFEATVAGGIPIIRTIRELLHVNRVTKIDGILNGTANFILSDMRGHQRPFHESLQLAQDLGYAEADPTFDIQGIDTFYKLMILCETLFGRQPDWAQVPREGIDAISQKDIEEAAKKGGRIKLVAEVEQTMGGQILARVAPIVVDSSQSLYGVEGVENAVTIHSDLLGALTLKGPGAGGDATASAIIEDFVKIFEPAQFNRRVAAFPKPPVAL